MSFRLNAGRPGWKAKTSSYRRISVRRWQHDGFLKAASSFSWGWWNDDGEQVASIGVSVGSGALPCLTVSYRWRRYGDEEWRPVSNTVSLVQTPGTYGGSLIWFTCPKCYRRTVHLYIAANCVACRCCLNLTYPSQCEDQLGRLHRRVQRIEDKLTRKGIHQKTRAQLSSEYVNAECELDALFCARAMQLFGVTN